jgi:subtilisin family serine protease
VRAPFAILGLLAALAAPAAAQPSPTPARPEVVVALEAPSLARAVAASRVLSAKTKARRLDVHSPTSSSYLRELARRQRVVARRIVRAVPSARIRWHYRVIFNGLAVVVPRDRLQQLSRIPGIAKVYPSVAYRAALDRSTQLIGADQLWGLPDFSTAGNGIKIGIIDDGLDQTHPFFDPAGYAYPPGFPKGNTAFTTPKVIVARAFAPPNASWRYASAPFDPVHSEHGTHVAGIAAGNHTIGAVPRRGPLAGVAPRAYLGNYKALTTPSDFGLIENSPEIVAAIEAAVADGMDVINMSFGEAEIEPTRNPVIAAVDAAASAGVVPVASAGNGFADAGRGSIISPGSAPSVIAVGAASKLDAIADFSSSGPSPISLLLKPDVSAPGVSILSSFPKRAGTWTQLSGTSMASPHVAGSAALLRQRHPDWTVAQIKSALVLTADPVYADRAHTLEAPTTRQGAGLIDLPRADAPLVFAAPTNLALGLVRRGRSATRTIDLTDAGGGAGEWAVSVRPQGQLDQVTFTTPSTVTVPGQLTVEASVSTEAPELDLTGFVVLQLGDETRRIPYWLRVTAPKLGTPSIVLNKPGVYHGNTKGRPARVAAYRYPDRPSGSGVVETLAGPEQVFRVRIDRAVANFGVVVTGQAGATRVFPRIVVAGDENRLTGYPALPIAINPYLRTVGNLVPASAAITPKPGRYDIVFDTRSAGRAGTFEFRLWIDDTTPPTAQLVTRRAPRDGSLQVEVADTGAGIDPNSIWATLDGHEFEARYSTRTGHVTIPLRGDLKAGRHRLELHVSDFQESKNMENVGPILPNTEILRASFTVTR